ncbi:class I SAM-dependent methyltransferase [Dysgonomonas sp. Marseille-P4677]|uniref:class I SAM-dependent methyltransferase n=1 Tax=Dysgonomonas sp. Marseille-P4677 TaxID=2364790 RepID=UPI001911E02E|nr:class I SAM-dependent methyltransferase [Dysgonomonas sp. Marseille-P4677]MBK5723027.1 class I SAM-dependent methyltransferase [Dysgonomonas sp. Marseille-P4677]
MNEERAAKFWDRLSKQFDKQGKLFYPAPVENAKKYLKDSDTVLDFGCATGTVTNEIAKHVTKVVGIDISSKMIEMAKDRANELNITNVYYKQATIFDKTLETESFNAVLAYNILHFFTDTEQVLHHISGLLKPNGTIIIVTACLKQRSLRNILNRLFLTPLMWSGVIPYMKYFSISEFQNILNNDFQIIAQENISQNYFFVAKKK